MEIALLIVLCIITITGIISVPVIAIYKKRTCNIKVIGKLIKINDYVTNSGSTMYIPVFGYEYNGTFYEGKLGKPLTSKQINKFSTDKEYVLRLNEKYPHIIVLDSIIDK